MYNLGLPKLNFTTILLSYSYDKKKIMQDDGHNRWMKGMELKRKNVE